MSRELNSCLPTATRTLHPPINAPVSTAQVAVNHFYFSGTDATHAEHIETIKQRMYVGLTPDQRFLPGELGMGLVEGKRLLLLSQWF